jgi:FkbM family methyltransferase
VNFGFYVDVGAHHPVVDSVSKGFYALGWRGIHIEPVAAYAELLRQDRPDETVLQIAVGATEGVLDLNVIADTGLSTGLAQVAQQHQQTHGFTAQTLQVPMRTLKSILAPYAGQAIHWLKIDVEGFEAQVLEGWDSQANRPWLMVVEATEPLSRTVNHHQWEHFLTAAQYEFVYFDGLNRFYVAAEHAELKAAFAAPINVFDEITVSETASPQLWLGMRAQRDTVLGQFQAKADAVQHQLQETVGALNGKLDQSQTRLALSEKLRISMTEEMAQLQMRLDDAQAQSVHAVAASAARVAQAEQQLWQMQRSVSWRMTQPFRWVSGLLPAFVHRHTRRSAKAAFWVLTPWRLPKRLQARTEAINRAALLGAQLPAHPSDLLGQPATSAPGGHPRQLEQGQGAGMKGQLRGLARRMSTWPVLGRWVRIGIAVIRLPEERLMVQQQLADQAQRLRVEAAALAAAKERLSRHEVFIATQIPKLARSLAEMNQAQQMALRSSQDRAPMPTGEKK